MRSAQPDMRKGAPLYRRREGKHMEKQKKTAPAKTANTVEDMQLHAFRRAVNRRTWLAALIGFFVVDLGIMFCVMAAELQMTETNVLVDILDYAVSFRVFTRLYRFVMYGIAAYAIVKLGRERAKTQIWVLLAFCFLSFFSLIAQTVLSSMVMEGVGFSAEVLQALLGAIGENIGYYILYLIAFMLPPTVLIWLCAVLAEEYRSQKTETEQKKNPMPGICISVAVVQTLLSAAEDLPESVMTFVANGSFFLDGREVFSFVFPYVLLLLIGVAGVFIMLGVARSFRRRIAVIRKKIPLSPPAESEEQAD